MSHEILGAAFELSIALACAVVGGIVATRLTLPPYLGYLAAGFVLSPHTPGHSADTEVLALAADASVALLLFILAVQSPLRMFRRRPLLVLAATGQFVGVAAVGACIAVLLHVDPTAAIVIGAALATSSTMVARAMLHDHFAPETRDVIGGWSLVQGAVALAAIAVVPDLTTAQTPSPVLAAAVVVPVGFVLGRPALRLAMRRCADSDHELVPLAVVAVVVLAVAAPAVLVGLPVSFGALAAGWLVADVDGARAALGRLLEVRELFVAVFLVGLGSLVDPLALSQHAGVGMAIVGLILLTKWSTSAAIAWGAGVARGRAILAAAALVPFGEVTFVLGQESLADGLVGADARDVLVAATALSIAGAGLATPGGRSAAPARVDPLSPVGRPDRARGHGPPSTGDVGVSRHALLPVWSFGVRRRLVLSNRDLEPT